MFIFVYNKERVDEEESYKNCSPVLLEAEMLCTFIQAIDEDDIIEVNGFARLRPSL
jgi:hypothetical protein